MVKTYALIVISCFGMNCVVTESQAAFFVRGLDCALFISVFRQLRVVTRNKKPPAVRVGNKGYTKNITYLVQ